jgi:hypothetical protein
MKKLVVLLSACICLADCAMYAGLVRTSYAGQKIALPSTKDNFQLFKESSFKSFVYYKTSLRSNFAVNYFSSLSISDTYMDVAYVVPYGYTFNFSIVSARLLPGENFITLVNLFPDYLTEKNGAMDLVLYRFENDRLISKKMALEMTLGKSLLLSSGKHNSDRSGPIRLELKDRNGKVLYSSALDDTCFVQLDTQEVKDGILAAKLSANLRSASSRDYYQINEGELWLKL